MQYVPHMAVLWPVKKTRRLHFRFFVRNINGDVLFGLTCSVIDSPEPVTSSFLLCHRLPHTGLNFIPVMSSCTSHGLNIIPVKCLVYFT